MAYDAASQLTGLNRYSDLAGTASVANTSYGYDLVGRLTNLTHKHGANTLASYGLVYDAANRITQSSGTDGVQNYSYDSTNQLTGANHTTQTAEAYSYDANGNRTNGGYGTGTNNQLLTDGTYNYTYDGEGNRTKRVEISTGKVTEYVWDYRNRLTSVLFKDGAGVVTKTIGYTYDGNDRRISKSIDGAVSERYVYDGSDIALVFDGAGNQTHRYLHGTGVDTVLADERGGAVVWALADNQGTIRDLVDGGGVILNHINYDSFGRVVSQTSPSVEFRYGYTGRESDTETGLDYYRARYYDASNGRFISEDPLGFGAGDGNLSRYVGNSPTNWNDPSGEIFGIDDVILIGGTVIISYVAGQAFFPQYAQAPTSACDNHPTPPDQELKQAGVEFVTGLGVSAAPGLLRSGLQGLSREAGSFGTACFIAGTLVITREGNKSIEDIQVGEYVWSYDQDSSNWVLKSVTQCLIHQYQGQIFKIEVNGKIVEATSNHPFWVIEGQELEKRPNPEDIAEYECGLRSGGRWVAAEHLQVGDLVLSRNEAKIAQRAKNVQPRPKPLLVMFLS
jgi:RHS repeat-associated protein